MAHNTAEISGIILRDGDDEPFLTSYQGRATDLEIQANEILKTRDFIIDIYC
jgi:hypothetical protein